MMQGIKKLRHEGERPHFYHVICQDLIFEKWREEQEAVAQQTDIKARRQTISVTD